MDQIAEAIVELQKEIPPDIDWGSADQRPYPIRARSRKPNSHRTGELSTARASSVVKYLISRGVPADRLVAAGYAEFQPVDPGNTEDAFPEKPAHRIEADEQIGCG